MAVVEMVFKGHSHPRRFCPLPPACCSQPRLAPACFYLWPAARNHACLAPACLCLLQSQYDSEIAVMKELDHPNVVKLYEVIRDPEQSKLLMIMEYVEGGCALQGSSIVKKVRGGVGWGG